MSRTTFTVSRAAEFFSEKELEMQMGAGRNRWLAMLLKELIDNALDATEAAGIRNPSITVTLGADELIVADNGPGIPTTTVVRSLDYLSRTSSNNLYVSPTRGQLGNALKCLYAAGFVDHGRGEVRIRACGVEHCISVGFDPIRNEPSLDHSTRTVADQSGTVVRITWPGAASELQGGGFMRADWLLWRYGLCNPHLSIELVEPDGEPRCLATPQLEKDFDFRKWKPNSPPSALWFDRSQFQQLLCAFLASEPQMVVRDFLRQFQGMSASYTQKDILDELDLQRTSITDAFTAEGEMLKEKVETLHDAIASWSEPIKTSRLGAIGKDRIPPRLEMLEGIRAESFTYKKIVIEDPVRPFIAEAWFIARDPAENPGRSLLVGLNHSPIMQPPADLIWRILQENNVEAEDPVVVLLHLVCPGFDYIDRGKSRIVFQDHQQEAIRQALDGALAKWKKVKARLRRDQKATERELEKLSRQRGVTAKEAAWAVMEQAYKKASGGGTYPANARQVMYAARGPIQDVTGESLNDQYFTQTLLPDFISENPQLTASWDVVYDDRGTFSEPHTRVRVPIGTIKVRAYVKDWGDPYVGDVAVSVPIDIGTSGPRGRYGAALFIEKEGFSALFEAAGTAELYDVAIFSTKGMSTTAARQLVDQLSGEGITIYLLHDFDAAGMTIASTIQNDGRRYRFTHPPRVIDMGLRLEQAMAMDLESEEFRFPSRQKADPRENLRRCGATEDEVDVLVQHGNPTSGGWRGQRIELNAMTAPQFVEFVHGQLEAHGVGKVIPDAETLVAAYWHVRQRDALMEKVRELIDEQQLIGILQSLQLRMIWKGGCSS